MFYFEIVDMKKIKELAVIQRVKTSHTSTNQDVNRTMKYPTQIETMMTSMMTTIVVRHWFVQRFQDWRHITS